MGEPKNEAPLFQSTVDIYFQNVHKTLFQSTVDIHFQNAHKTQKNCEGSHCAFIDRIIISKLDMEVKYEAIFSHMTA